MLAGVELYDGRVGACRSSRPAVGDACPIGSGNPYELLTVVSKTLDRRGIGHLRGGVGRILLLADKVRDEAESGNRDRSGRQCGCGLFRL